MLNENQLKFMRYCLWHDFRGKADLCKSGKEYLNAETCKLYTSSVHSFETFGILHVFPSINIAKLQKLKYPC